jgi:DNA invertase Pin-like site-specific DNA recombinase
MADLRERRVGFKVLEQPVDTTTSTGRLVAGILAAVAEFELEIRRERQREGIDRAKRNGVYRGRRPVLKPEREQRLVDLHLNEGVPVKQLAREEGVSRATLYRAIERAKDREAAET